MTFTNLLPKIVNLQDAERETGTFLRTPEAIRNAGYRLVQERDGDRYYLAKATELQPLLVRLGDIAEVRFGIKTGANEFFYLEPVGWTVAQVMAGAAGATVRVQNGAGWQGEIEVEFLKPIITSLKEVPSLKAESSGVRRLIFACPLTKDALAKQGKSFALAYIEWGEKRLYHRRATCVHRTPWWNIGEQEIPGVIFSRRLGDRHVVPYNSIAHVSDTLYGVYTEQAKELAAIMSSVPFRLFIETKGRELTGAITVVEMYIPDLLRSPIPNPSALTTAQRERLLEAFEQMASREVKSIFEELGLPKPNRDFSNIRPEEVSLEKVLPDRRALDAVVFEVLGLNEQEQLEVYRAVVELVKSRLVKARSV